MFTVDLVSDLRRREGVRDKGREKDKEKGRKVGTGRERRKGKEGSLHASVTYHMLVHALFFFRVISFMRASSILSHSSCKCCCCSRTVSMVTTPTAVDRARYTHSDLKIVL